MIIASACFATMAALIKAIGPSLPVGSGKPRTQFPHNFEQQFRKSSNSLSAETSNTFSPLSGKGVRGSGN
ncbi:MAG: hypothetical protein UMU76_01625, partial [Prosthecochloris sp.]|nr:hypothetical protein [Prosthecochloris sp.]